MDKELKKKLGITWQGTILSVTTLPNYKEYEKASCVFNVEGGDLNDILELEAFGYSASDLKKCNNGDQVEVAFLPKSRLSTNGKYYTTLDLLRIKILKSAGIQEEIRTPEPAENIYPSGNSLPGVKSDAKPVAESDFDFGEDTTPPF